jgi:hypothetical protein
MCLRVNSNKVTQDNELITVNRFAEISLSRYKVRRTRQKVLADPSAERR